MKCSSYIDNVYIFVKGGAQFVMSRIDVLRTELKLSCSPAPVPTSILNIVKSHRELAKAPARGIRVMFRRQYKKAIFLPNLSPI